MFMVVKVEKAPVYVRLFDKKAVSWDKDPEKNKFFLLMQQNYANEKLKARGYLFLNEVLDILGMARTKAGQIVGWMYDPENPNSDSYVDFGVFKGESSYATGVDGAIVLSFNVDGDILSRM
jgi:hypothetical protein